MNHVLAKKCQYILSDLEYRTYLHHWNCSPEEHDVIQAKRAQEILSDVRISHIYLTFYKVIFSRYLNIKCFQVFLQYLNMKLVTMVLDCLVSQYQRFLHFLGRILMIYLFLSHL